MQSLDVAALKDYAIEAAAVLAGAYSLMRFIFIPRAKAFVRAELADTIKAVTNLGGRMDALEKDAAGTQRAVEKLSENVDRGLERITTSITAISLAVSDNAVKTAELVGELKGRREGQEERRTLHP